jgi:predicted outer membrane repeat protein
MMKNSSLVEGMRNKIKGLFISNQAKIIGGAICVVPLILITDFILDISGISNNTLDHLVLAILP